jgi:hypothetical protein
MILSLLRSWLRTVKRHIDTHERYRWWSLYAVCLVTFMYSTHFWPWNGSEWLVAFHLHPWIAWVDILTWKAGGFLACALAVVALVRSGWVNRVLAAYALWMGHFMLTYSEWGFLDGFWTEFTWYAFDVPAKWISGYAGEGTTVSTLLWFVYLVVVWIAVRPLLKRAYRYVPRLEARMLERWPVLTRLSRPVM